MRFVEALFDIAHALDGIAESIDKLSATLGAEHAPAPDSYEEYIPAGVYNPTEDDMVGWLQQYGEFHPEAVSNPYRGWTVFRDDETED